jgi:hypothetical protein
MPAQYAIIFIFNTFTPIFGNRAVSPSPIPYPVNAGMQTQDLELTAGAQHGAPLRAGEIPALPVRIGTGLRRDAGFSLLDNLPIARVYV